MQLSRQLALWTAIQTITPGRFERAIAPATAHATVQKPLSHLLRSPPIRPNDDITEEFIIRRALEIKNVQSLWN
jgi:hypothetical protein